MNDFIKFIVDNWQFVSTVAISIFSFILLLIFRRSKSILVDDGFYCEVLKLVIDAEELYGAGHGKEKLDFVITSMSANHQYGHVIDGFSRLVEVAVNDILSSPQKKVK